MEAPTGKIIEGPKLRYPIEKKSAGQFLFDYATKHGNKVCQVDATSNQSETFSSVKQRSTRVAMSMQMAGITKSDVVAFCSNRTLDITIPILATSYIGAIPSSLDPSLSVRNSQHLLKIVTPKMVFVEEDSLNLIEEALQEANIEAEIVVIGHSTKYSTLKGFLELQENEAAFCPVDVDLEDTAYIFFSSGSTGLPKAICLSHNTFLFDAAAARQFNFQYDSILSFTSFYWISELFVLMASFVSGGCRVICPYFETVHPSFIFEIIEKYKVTFITSLPEFMYYMTDYPDGSKYNISSVKCMEIGGSPVGHAQRKKTKDLFKNSAVIFGYGMTEAGYITLFDPDDADLLSSKLGSCGKAAVGISIKVADLETGQTLGPQQRGEIRVKTPALMKGYYKADASELFDSEGFFKTGDVGYYDDDECFYVVDRLREMFKYQSWHIVPSSVEAVLREHPSVKEAVVFGIPHETDGDLPAAAVVLEPGTTAEVDELIQFVAKKVLDREHLRGGLAIVEELAKTPTGKFMRRAIRDAYLETRNTSK